MIEYKNRAPYARYCAAPKYSFMKLSFQKVGEVSIIAPAGYQLSHSKSRHLHETKSGTTQPRNKLIARAQTHPHLARMTTLCCENIDATRAGVRVVGSAVGAVAYRAKLGAALAAADFGAAVVLVVALDGAEDTATNAVVTTPFDQHGVVLEGGTGSSEAGQGEKNSEGGGGKHFGGGIEIKEVS